MRTVIALLLSLFAPNVLGAQVFPGCEILLETRYGRIMNLAVQSGQVSPTQLDEVINQDSPMNPLDARDIDNLFVFRTLESSAKSKRTREDWPRIRESLIVLREHMRSESALVQQAQDDTKWIFAPKLHMKVNYKVSSENHFMFNPKRGTLFQWSSSSKGTDYLNIGLKNKSENVGSHGSYTRAILRKNGQIWTVGAYSNFGVVVSRVGALEPHFKLAGYSSSSATLFESQNGRLYLGISYMREFIAFDITVKDDPKILAQESGTFMPNSFFHSSDDGELYWAVEKDLTTEIYRLRGEKFVKFGSTVGTLSGRRHVILTSDKEGNLYVGEPTKMREFRVIKFSKDGTQAPVVNKRGLEFYTPMFYWDSRGDLILCYSGTSSAPAVHLVNLSDGKIPEKIFPIPAEFRNPAAWHRFSNGLEVLALSPDGKNAIALSTDDGAVLYTFPALIDPVFNRITSGPVWGRMPDGQNYLAIDSDDHLHIYDVGNDKLSNERKER